MLWRKETRNILPCAGITLIRSYGYDLRLVLPTVGRDTPGNTETSKAFKTKAKELLQRYRRKMIPGL
jgi:hypothetical protein